MYSDENIFEVKRQTAATIRETNLYWCGDQRYKVSLMLWGRAVLKKTAEQVHSLLMARSRRHLLHTL